MQGRGSLAGPIKIDDTLGSVRPRLPTARSYDAVHHQIRAVEVMVLSQMACHPLKNLSGTEHLRKQAPAGDIIIAIDQEQRGRARVATALAVPPPARTNRASGPASSACRNCASNCPPEGDMRSQDG